MAELLGGLMGAMLMIGLIVVVRSFRPAPPKRTDPIGDIDPRTLRIMQWISGQLFLTAFVWYVSDWPSLALGVGALVWVVRLWLIANQERKNYHLTTEAISVWVDMVKDSLGGGAGLSQAIESTTTLAPEIIRPEVGRLASRQRTGSQTAALLEFGDALAHPTSDLVVLALVSASENQARDLPRLLSKTAEQARSRNESVLEIETERSKLYAEARAMVIAIAILGVIISIIARDFLEPYSRPLGQFVLAIIMVIVVGSAAMLVQAGRPQTDDRLLATTTVMGRS